MSIFCWGRRYPNAPFTHYTGCIGRGPPHYLFGSFTGLIDEAAVFNGTTIAAPFGTFLGKLHNPTICWRSGPTAHFPDFWFSICIDQENGPWEMRMVLSSILSDTPFREAWRRWKTERPEGFNFAVQDSQTLIHDAQSEWWTFAGDSPVKVINGTYARLPANSCIGV